MDRLTGMDWVLLNAENDDTYMHMSGVVVLDPRGVPGFDYDTFRSFVCERMALVPRLRRRLQGVPFGIDFPILVDDPDFDPRSHVHRVAVPAPGGPHEVAEVVSALLPLQLDRRHPLWDVWYLDGLADGRVAYLSKIHHSLFDGVTSVALSQVLFDIEPAPAAPPALGDTESSESPRSRVELFARGLGHVATSPVRVAQLVVQSARQLATLARYTRRPDAPPLMMRTPHTPWNAGIGPRRAWAYGHLPLPELKRLRADLGVSVNDAVCGVAGGALRSYLLKEGELPEKPVVAIVPASPRLGQAGGVGTVMTAMMLSLGTDIEDPVERVLAIHKAAAVGKERVLAARAHHVTGITEVVPPTVIRALIKAGGNLSVAGLANTIVTNTPGSPIPLYCAGAPVEATLPCGMLGVGVGLTLFITSYVDRLEFGVITDPRLVPDPWSVVEFMRDAFHELQAAAEPGSAEGHSESEPASTTISA